jgi:hypothetical protein
MIALRRLYLRAAVLFVAVFCEVAHVRASDVAANDANSGSIFGYVKAMYVVDDKKGGRFNQSTPGFGGKIGGETAEFDGFRLKGALYTTSDLGLRSSNPKQTDTYMFDLDKRPYSLLGEAQFQYRGWKTMLTAGRQEFLSPIINTYDYRIIPNLFEAYTLTNRDVANTTLTLSYVSKMSGLDGLVSFSEFRSMSQQAYTSLLVTPNGTIDASAGDTLVPSSVVGYKGVWVIGAGYENTHKFQLWNYYGTDTLNTLYVDGQFKQQVSRDFSSTMDMQAYRVCAVGRFKDYLSQHGLNASYALYGIKGSLAHKPSGVSVSLAFNRFTGNEKTVTAYGNWGGYPEFVSMPYMYAENSSVSAIANAQLARLTMLLDLEPYGFKDQSLLLGHARINIDESILPGSDTHMSTALYRVKLSTKLSARVAFEARDSGKSRYDNEFLAIGMRYDF